MPRYFLEVAYNGKDYAGFQIQQNAETIQGRVEKALGIFYHRQFQLTGASRTDAGVHANQNYFHFDAAELEILIDHMYNLNAILPGDIVIKNCFKVADNAHCRFDALYRTYEYKIYQYKNPFYIASAFFYPFKLDIELLNSAAVYITGIKDFSAFSKRNTQVNNHQCNVMESNWKIDSDGLLFYTVTANRFLRGMVRGLVATMLRVGTKKISLSEFRNIIEQKDQSRADFSAPAHALYLKRVIYPSLIF